MRLVQQSLLHHTTSSSCIYIKEYNQQAARSKQQANSETFQQPSRAALQLQM